ncbi:hypothetical protein B5F39_13705 [Cloacibacillus sp. An23]|nr:hypothetical protein B5F39_13705 [Cloacibacillus sp. An23]
MFSDERFFDFERMRGRYSEAAFREFVSLLNDVAYTELPLRDASGRRFAYIRVKAGSCAKAARILMTHGGYARPYPFAAMAEEIVSSLALEGIDVSFENVRNILNGSAPSGYCENLAYCMKLALDFISDDANVITERNAEKLLRLLEPPPALESGRTETETPAALREDTSGGNVHGKAGMSENAGKISDFLQALTDFVNSEDDIDELLKAAAIHFFVLHSRPIGSRSGLAARMIHLWVLARMGYHASLAVPLSRSVNAARAEYREAFTLVLRNAGITGILDVTPFLSFFAREVYGKIGPLRETGESAERFAELMKEGKITTKERELWEFVQSYYGAEEFSTKTLERDFRSAAYATVRAFVVKFEQLGLLASVKYTNKSRYRAL